MRKRTGRPLGSPPQSADRGSTAYTLLPFGFHPITSDREVLVNEVGDYLLCPRGTATRIARRAVSPREPIYSELLANFFVSDSTTPELIDVLATRYRTRKSFLDSFTSLHIIVVTLRCNHSCHYCQVSRRGVDQHRYTISRVDLDHALALVFRSPSPQITIEFQGGEPLLAFGRVQEAVERAEELNRVYNKNLQFVLCTNLTLLSRDMADFCRAHGVHISTSLDGPELVHDQNRPMRGGSSLAAFREGLQLAREVIGPTMVSAMMTTSRLSLDHAEEIVDAYVECGFGHIFIRPMHPYGYASRLAADRRYSTEQFLQFYRRCLSYLLELNRGGTWLVEDYAAIVLRKILTPFSDGFVDLRSPSGIVNDVAAYNYDGGVYASDESRMLAESGDHTFRLGHVGDHYSELFYGQKVQELAQHWANESLAGCSECGLRNYCGADPVRSYATQGDLEGYRPTSDFCRKNMEIIRFLLEVLDCDPTAERIFRRWTA